MADFPVQGESPYGAKVKAYIDAGDADKAPLNSPTFTGDPKAPTPAVGDNDTSIATTAFVKAQGYATQSAVDAKAPLNSPTFTGDPKAPTPATADNDTSIATTAFVKAQGYVPNTRSVNSGTGLTGGGDLSTNRTLSVTYGTAAGTAAQGNDSRITGAAQKSANLSDLANAATARTNLGLGTAATQASSAFATAAQGSLADTAVQPGDLGNSASRNVGTGAGTVAAGDDSRITGAAQKSANLSDLGNPSTARTNLGLGTAATKNTGTADGDVPLLGTGGRLPISMVASGTPDGTKFVRDDGTLAVPPGGGGGGGSGDVVGPGSSVSGNLVTFSGTSGKIIQDSGLAATAVAPLNSPAFTGNPTAPTPVTSDNDTSIATTAFVKAQGYVPGTRSVAAGTGLSGGGDLSADRTLSVSYGTTAGTAAQGNDSRITGAAQKAANLSDLANAATARTNLGLGNSASRDVGTGSGDVAAGNLGVPASGTTGHVLTKTSGGHAWQASGGLLAVVSEVRTTASTDTLTAIPGMSCTFTVPASGRVLVRASGMYSGTGFIAWGILESGVTVVEATITDGNSSAVLGVRGVPFLITGLTPEAVKTYSWGHRYTVGSSGPALSSECPLVLEVWAA